MKLIVSILLLLFGVVHLTSCDEQEEVEVRKKIARAGDVFLFEEELLNDFPSGLSKEDSALFVGQYVQSWLQEQILLNKAEEELPNETKDVKSKLEKYRKSLIVYSYEQHYIKQRLDTVVEETEIEAYYNEHLEEFMLKDYIVKALYIKLSNQTPDIGAVGEMYKLKNPTDEYDIRNYADKFAIKFYYDTVQWLFFEDVLKEVPLPELNKESFVRKKKKVTFEEEEFTYFLNILDYRLKDAVSPLNFEREKIKNIILNLRTNQMRKNLRENLFEDAKKAQVVETY